MTAWIRYAQLKIGVKFFARLHVDVHRLSLYRGYSSRVGVEYELGVDQIAMVLQQPIDAVRFSTLFISGQRENKIAIRAVLLLMKSYEGGDQDGIVHLHVLRTTAIEIAVFFDKLEGIGGPILA